MVAWHGLIDQLKINRSSVKLLNSKDQLFNFKAENSEFSEWIAEIDRRGFKCLIKHEAMAYLIQTPHNSCIVWISWVGARGSRWHIVKFFPLGKSSLTYSIKNMAQILVNSYQDAWVMSNDH